MTNTDVFLRVAPQNDIRLHMALTCVAYWRTVPNVNLHIIFSKMMKGFHHFGFEEKPIFLSMEGFHWSSRQYADDHSESDPYVLCDDDRLPMGDNWLSKALDHWKEDNADHKYVMMTDRSALWLDDVTKLNPVYRESVSEVIESPLFNGPNYLSYKGAIPYPEFVNVPSNIQDPAIGDWAHKHGKKQALMRDVVSNHIGVSFSQTQPVLWGRY